MGDKAKDVKVDGISFMIDIAISQGKEKFIREHIATHYEGLPVKDRAVKLANAYDIIAAKAAESNKKDDKVVTEKPDAETESAIKDALKTPSVSL